MKRKSLNESNGAIGASMKPFTYAAFVLRIVRKFVNHVTGRMVTVKCVGIKMTNVKQLPQHEISKLLNLHC